MNSLVSRRDGNERLRWCIAQTTLWDAVQDAVQNAVQNAVQDATHGAGASCVCMDAHAHGVKHGVKHVASSARCKGRSDMPQGRRVPYSVVVAVAEEHKPTTRSFCSRSVGVEAISDM